MDKIINDKNGLPIYNTLKINFWKPGDKYSSITYVPENTDWKTGFWIDKDRNYMGFYDDATWASNYTVPSKPKWFILPHRIYSIELVPAKPE